MKFSAAKSLPLTDVNTILNVKIFHYADRKYYLKKVKQKIQSTVHNYKSIKNPAKPLKP